MKRDRDSDASTKSLASSEEQDSKKSKGYSSSEKQNDKGISSEDKAQSKITTTEETEPEASQDQHADSSTCKSDLVDIPAMKRDATAVRNSIFEEGLISPRRFQQLEELKHDVYDDTYIHKYYDMYFEHAYKLYAEIEEAFINAQLMEEPRTIENKTVEDFIKRLKDITEPVGALKILNEINKMSQSCENRDIEGVMSAFEQVELENEKLFKKIDPYFKLRYYIMSRERIPELKKLKELGRKLPEWKLKISNSALEIEDESSSSSESGDDPQEAGPSVIGESSQHDESESSESSESSE